jgi:hypothetical protein
MLVIRFEDLGPGKKEPMLMTAVTRRGTVTEKDTRILLPNGHW